MSYRFNADEAFKVAVNIEENGKKFYDDAVKIVQDPGVKKLFENLSAEEVSHKKRFEDFRKNLPKSATSSDIWDPDNDVDQYIKMMADQHVFVSGESLKAELARVTDSKSALRLAMSFEKDSVIFFLSLEDAAEGTSREFIRTLVKEEQEHLKRLAAELTRISR